MHNARVVELGELSHRFQKIGKDNRQQWIPQSEAWGNEAKRYNRAPRKLEKLETLNV